MGKLAINGGKPIRTQKFPAHNMIGEEEKKAVMQVLDSGVLSKFLGCWHPDFYGGPQVLEFEKQWAEFCDAKHAISVNSNTSGLYAAIGAAGICPGDEVIVSPYTMSASATAIIGWNGVPVFADIQDDIFCLDPKSIAEKITPYTKAIMVVDIFGHPADLDPIMELARKHNLVVIEDAAQAPGGVYKKRKIGSIADMTVFSLNYHKHIHTGEGGIVTTNNPEFAERLQLIRNHGENIVGPKNIRNLSNTYGFNLRFTEIHAAIAIAQLEKLPRLLDMRVANADYLNREIGKLPGIRPPVVYPDCTHVYYVQPFLYNAEVVGVSREKFVEAINKELPTAEDRDWELIFTGYLEPLYMAPMYQQQIANGPSGFPFKSPYYKGQINYAKGLCPVTERIEEKEMIGSEFMRPPCTLQDMKDVADAFHKVYENRSELV